VYQDGCNKHSEFPAILGQQLYKPPTSLKSANMKSVGKTLVSKLMIENVTLYLYTFVLVAVMGRKV